MSQEAHFDADLINVIELIILQNKKTKGENYAITCLALFSLNANSACALFHMHAFKSKTSHSNKESLQCLWSSQNHERQNIKATV